VYDCPALSANIGDACDDGNANTSNDVINANCECVGEMVYDCPALSANIGDACDDGNANTSSDVISANCECEGEIVFDCPAISANFGDACDDGNANTLNDKINANCECAGTPILYETTSICVQVNERRDDAEEDLATGSVSTTSGDLELVFDGPATGPFINQKVGIRFKSHNIPKGVIITNATIQFTADISVGVNPCNLNIRGEASDNAAAFTTAINNISSRPVTNASVLWSPPNWMAGNSGAAQQTNDISAILQEIIDRDGYVTGNAIAIIIDGVGKRTARSFDNANGGAAILCVTYQRACPDNNNDLICDDNICPDGPEPGTLCDDGNPATINDVIDGNCACAGIPGVTLDVCSRINSGSDDAEENTATRIVNLTSGDIELLLEGPHLGPYTAQIVGLRFNNLNIPNGATINNAHIQFTSESSANVDPSSIDIYGEASDNAITFSNMLNNISSRTKTSASILGWSPLAWTSTGVSGPNQRTPNIAAVVQEIVNRPGYTSSSAISILFEGTGRRLAVSFETNPLQAAEMCITYSIPNGSTPLSSNGSGEFEPDEENSDTDQNSSQNTDYYSLYPVPTAKDLNVDLSKQEGKPARISVYNHIGQLMEIVEIEKVPATPVVLNIEDYLNGIYYMSIEFENARAVSKKFIVSRLY
jgi:Secretion system C-terminal sorting domain